MSLNAIDGLNNLRFTNNNINFRSEKVTTPELKEDTVELSTAKPQKKKEGMSDGMKLLPY